MPDLQEIIRLAVIFIYFVLFATSAFEKVKNLTVPDWFLQQFSESYLGPYPTLIKMGYWGITALESGLTIAFVASLFIPALLPVALVASLFLFAILCFGLRISYDFQGSANMFTYFAATLISLMALS
jgi:hypothetical protein